MMSNVSNMNAVSSYCFWCYSFMSSVPLHRNIFISPQLSFVHKHSSCRENESVSSISNENTLLSKWIMSKTNQNWTQMDRTQYNSNEEWTDVTLTRTWWIIKIKNNKLSWNYLDHSTATSSKFKWQCPLSNSHWTRTVPSSNGTQIEHKLSNQIEYNSNYK